MKRPQLHLLCVCLAAWVSGCLSLRRDTALKRLADSCFSDPSNCCFQEDEEPWVQRSPRCAFDPVNQSYPCAIKLGVNNWDSSFLNVYVARVFIVSHIFRFIVANI